MHWRTPGSHPKTLKLIIPAICEVLYCAWQFVFSSLRNLKSPGSKRWPSSMKMKHPDRHKSKETLCLTWDSSAKKLEIFGRCYTLLAFEMQKIAFIFTFFFMIDFSFNSRRLCLTSSKLNFTHSLGVQLNVFSIFLKPAVLVASCMWIIINVCSTDSNELVYILEKGKPSETQELLSSPISIWACNVLPQ